MGHIDYYVGGKKLSNEEVKLTLIQKEFPGCNIKNVSGESCAQGFKIRTILWENKDGKLVLTTAIYRQEGSYLTVKCLTDYQKATKTQLDKLLKSHEEHGHLEEWEIEDIARCQEKFAKEKGILDSLKAGKSILVRVNGVDYDVRYIGKRLFAYDQDKRCYTISKKTAIENAVI